MLADDLFISFCRNQELVTAGGLINRWRSKSDSEFILIPCRMSIIDGQEDYTLFTIIFILVFNVR